MLRLSKQLFTQSLAGLRVLLVLTILTGLLYPAAVWSAGRLPGLRARAEGSVVAVDGTPVGSTLIGVDPVAADPDADPWFHTRPSATGDPSTSGGSNKGTRNADLTAKIQERIDAVAARENVAPHRVPVDAVTASASGLDPHISRAYALLQAPRVARNTGVPEDRVRALIEEHTEGVLGEPGVNVLKLNLAVRA